LYQGEDKAGMPDLVVQFVEGVFGHVLPMGEEVVTKPEYLTTEKGFMQLLGTHSQRGVFLAHGRDVKAGFELDGEIVDIVPTVLGYMGIPIPSHVDGKALEAAFKRSLELSYEDKAKVETKKARYTDEEEAEIQQKLSDLGYL
jgi:predicted AlkP superfamily phosphohydrolase/phosphomutase